MAAHEDNSTRVHANGLSVPVSDAAVDPGTSAHLAEIRDFIEDTETKSKSPLQTVARSLRGRLLIAMQLSVLFAVAGGVAGFLSSKPLYVSRGTIQVSATKPAILYGDPDNALLRMFDAFVLAEASYLESRAIMERALGLLPHDNRDWTTIPEGVRMIQEAIRVQSKEGLIFIEAEHHDPKRAAAIVNSMLEAYEETQLEQSRQQASIRDRELSQREKQLIDRIRFIDTETLRIGQEYGPRSIVAAHVSKVSQIAAVDERLAELSTTIANREANVAVNEVDVGDQEVKRLIMLDHGIADLITSRAQLSGELAAEMSESQKLRDPTRYSFKGWSKIEEKIRVIDQAIEDRRRQITTLGTTGALTKQETTDENDPNSVEQLRLLRSRLEIRLEELRSEAKELHSKLIQLEFLQGEREEIRGHLEETRQALEQIRLESENSLPGRVAVKARGNVPDEPAVNKRKQFAVAGAGAGGFGGLALVVAFAFVVRRYRFSDDMDNLAAFGRSAGVIPRLTDSSDIEVQGFSRAIDRMRTDLQLTAPVTRKGIVIAVTGLHAGAGASTIALSLAQSFAKARMRTAIVDADLVDRTISTRLGLDHEPGFSEAVGERVLNGQVHGMSQENLSAIPAGMNPGFTDESLARGTLSRFMDNLRATQDVSIVDVGPFDERLVARLAAILSDQSVVVVPAGCDGVKADAATSVLARLAPQRTHFAFNFARRGDPGLIPSAARRDRPAQADFVGQVTTQDSNLRPRDEHARGW